jgi:hypothetical protein
VGEPGELLEIVGVGSRTVQVSRAGVQVATCLFGLGWVREGVVGP